MIIIYMKQPFIFLRITDSMQKWINLGPVLQIENSEAWMHSHIAVPTVERTGPNSVRIYFCSRDEMNRSQIGCAEIDVSKPN